jgi:transcriptional regulator with XRE-family HTH domain
MVDYRLIGSRIKKQREQMKLTQEVVAEKASITTVYLSKIENGKVHPTLDTLCAICTILHCDLGEILLASTCESNTYQSEAVVQIFNSCAPEVKPIAINLLEQLAKLSSEITHDSFGS